VPRKVVISAWVVPVMALGQFSFFAAIHGRLRAPRISLLTA